MELTVQMILESLIGNKLINKHFLPIGNAVSNQGNQVPVMHSADNFHLCLELSLSLPTASLELLDRNFLPIGEYPLVDVPKCTLTQEIGI